MLDKLVPAVHIFYYISSIYDNPEFRTTYIPCYAMPSYAFLHVPIKNFIVHLFLAQ